LVSNPLDLWTEEYKTQKKGAIEFRRIDNIENQQGFFLKLTGNRYVSRRIHYRCI